MNEIVGKQEDEAPPKLDFYRLMPMRAAREKRLANPMGLADQKKTHRRQIDSVILCPANAITERRFQCMFCRGPYRRPSKNQDCCTKYVWPK